MFIEWNEHILIINVVVNFYSDVINPLKCNGHIRFCDIGIQYDPYWHFVFFYQL